MREFEERGRVKEWEAGSRRGRRGSLQSAFLEAETPYLTPEYTEYHDLAPLEPAGGRAQDPLGADGKTTSVT